jgi:hypothetical protein
MSELIRVSKTKFDPTVDNLASFPPRKKALTADSKTGIHFFKRHSKVHIANHLELRQKTYELVHKIYSKIGLASDEPDGLWLTIYDALPETTTFVAENGAKDVDGALTLVFDSPIGLPADTLYKEEIDRLRSSGSRVSEIISLGIRDTAKGSVKFLAGLVYSAYLLSRHSKNSTDFVITVHPRYENFYCRYLLFNKIGPVRNYDRVNGAPAILLNLPLMLPDLVKNKQRVFPLSMLNYSKEQELEIVDKLESMRSPLSEEEFNYFFIEKTEIWKNASPQQKNYIKNFYPSLLNNHF